MLTDTSSVVATTSVIARALSIVSARVTVRCDASIAPLAKLNVLSDTVGGAAASSANTLDDRMNAVAAQIDTIRRVIGARLASRRSPAGIGWVPDRPGDSRRCVIDTARAYKWRERKKEWRSESARHRNQKIIR